MLQLALRNKTKKRCCRKWPRSGVLQLGAFNPLKSNAQILAYVYFGDWGGSATQEIGKEIHDPQVSKLQGGGVRGRSIISLFNNSEMEVLRF